MSMVWQHESDDICLWSESQGELMITGLSVLPYLFHYKNKNVYLFTMGFLIFGIHIKILGDLFLPHHTHFAPSYASLVISLHTTKLNSFVHIPSPR